MPRDTIRFRNGSTVQLVPGIDVLHGVELNPTRKEKDRYAGRFVQYIVFQPVPGQFVVRCVAIMDSGTPWQSFQPLTTGTLAYVRHAIPSGYVRQDPTGLDDGQIVEVWS